MGNHPSNYREVSLHRDSRVKNPLLGHGTLKKDYGWQSDQDNETVPSMDDISKRISCQFLFPDSNTQEQINVDRSVPAFKDSDNCNNKMGEIHTIQTDLCRHNNKSNGMVISSYSSNFLLRNPNMHHHDSKKQFWSDSLAWNYGKSKHIFNQHLKEIPKSLSRIDATNSVAPRKNSINDIWGIRNGALMEEDAYETNLRNGHGSHKASTLGRKSRKHIEAPAPPKMYSQRDKDLYSSLQSLREKLGDKIEERHNSLENNEEYITEFEIAHAKLEDVIMNAARNEGVTDYDETDESNSYENLPTAINEESKEINLDEKIRKGIEETHSNAKHSENELYENLKSMSDSLPSRKPTKKQGKVERENTAFGLLSRKESADFSPENKQTKMKKEASVTSENISSAENDLLLQQVIMEGAIKKAREVDNVLNTKSSSVDDSTSAQHGAKKGAEKQNKAQLERLYKQRAYNFHDYPPLESHELALMYSNPFSLDTKTKHPERPERSKKRNSLKKENREVFDHLNKSKQMSLKDEIPRYKDSHVGNAQEHEWKEYHERKKRQIFAANPSTSLKTTKDQSSANQSFNRTHNTYPELSNNSDSFLRSNYHTRPSFKINHVLKNISNSNVTAGHPKMSEYPNRTFSSEENQRDNLGHVRRHSNHFPFVDTPDYPEVNGHNVNSDSNPSNKKNNSNKLLNFINGNKSVKDTYQQNLYKQKYHQNSSVLRHSSFNVSAYPFSEAQYPPNSEKMYRHKSMNIPPLHTNNMYPGKRKFSLGKINDPFQNNVNRSQSAKEGSTGSKEGYRLRRRSTNGRKISENKPQVPMVEDENGIVWVSRTMEKLVPCLSATGKLLYVPENVIREQFVPSVEPSAVFNSPSMYPRI